MTDQEHADGILLKMGFVRQACEDARDAGLTIVTPSNWEIQIFREFNSKQRRQTNDR